MTFIIFAGLAAFFLIAEKLFSTRHRKSPRSGLWGDLMYAFIYFLMRISINGFIAGGVIEWLHFTMPGFLPELLKKKPVWLQTLVLLLVLDFIFYVNHRLKHRWPYWWRLHETHHSSDSLDFLSAARFHVLEKIIDRMIYILPIAVFDVSMTTLVIWASVDAFFGMFSHSNLRWRMGPLKYIFMCPEMHRWHHVKDARQSRCNFGNNFSIFDWIFGTAYISDKEPADFGIRDTAYPKDSLVKQFFYAFRPFSE